MKLSRLLAYGVAALLAFSPAIGLAKGSLKAKVKNSSVLSPKNNPNPAPHAGHVKVKGYTKKNGTVVAPYHRSAPNDTKADNWSTKGNVNPDTGQAGTK